jgi:hypothetical protein
LFLVQLLISPHAVQAAPIAVSDTFTTAEDTVLVIAAPGVLANDTSIEGPSLQAIFGSGPSHGTVILNRDGSFRYTPQSNYNGSDSFRYSVWDGSRQSSTVAVNLTVTPVNDAPTGITLFGGTVPENVPLGTQTGWFTTQDPETTIGFTYTLSGEGAEVLEMFNVNYVRTKAGLDYETKRIYALRVRTTDSGGLPYEHDFVITVTNVNEAPTAVDDSYTPTEDMAMIVLVPGVMANDSDVDRDSLIARLLTGPVYGTLTLQANGSFTYVPVGDYCGSDAFTYEAWDGFLASAPATVNLMVVSINDSPSFTKGTDQAVFEDCGVQTVNPWATAISVGPANETPQVLTFIATNNNNALFSVQPAVDPATGILTYTLAANMNGAATVSLTLTDDAARGGAALTTTPQTFTITVIPINDVPSFTKGADQTLLEDCGAQTVALWTTAISAGPADEAGQVLQFDVTNGNNALFSAQPAVSPTGVLTYAPVAKMNGSATVILHIRDDGGVVNGGVDASADQTFIITVTAVNNPPVNTALPAVSGIPHVGRTLTTTNGVWNDLIDTGVSGTSVLSYAYRWQRSTDGGSTFADIGDATGSSYLLTLPDNLQQVRVQVTCSDSGVGQLIPQSTAVFSLPVPVTILNAAPVFPAGPAVTASCDEDEAPVAFNLNLEVIDPDAIDTLTWSVVTPPAHGSLTLPPPAVGGMIASSVYHPASNWNGTDSFTLRVDDGLTGTASITVTVTVIPRDDAPVNTVRPSIAGNLVVNHEVRAVVGNWNDAIDTDVSGTSVLSYTYQWLRARDAAGTGLALIPGATASTYIVSPIDGGMYLAVRVTCADSGMGLPATMSATVDSAFLSARSLDMMPPTIDLPDFSSWPGVTGWFGGVAPSFTVNRSPFDLQFTVADDQSSVQWKVATNGVEASSSVGPGTINRPISLTECTNRVDITAIDEAGNRTERHLTVALDTRAPEVVLPKPLMRMIIGTMLNVEGTMSDEVSGVRSLTIDGTRVIPYLDGTFTASLPLKRGLNTIDVETLDNAGNRGSLTWVVDLTSVQQPHSGRRIDLIIDRKVIVVDGASVTMDVAPVILVSRTFLPLRALVEEVGGSITWNAKTRQVTVKARGITMVLTISKNMATVNGKSILIDPANSKVVPIILGSRTFLPVRFISEQLGLGVTWDAPTRMVTITWEP